MADVIKIDTFSKVPKIQALRKYVDRRLVGLRVDRWSYWQHWRQLSDFILPRRGRYLMTPNQATRGDPVGSRMINETPIFALILSCVQDETVVE
ncbi:MAG: hypothetical protein WB930_16620 [Syntrophobacteraceae bacterium]